MLNPDNKTNLNGVTVNEYLLTKHNPNRITMPTIAMEGKVIGVTVHNTDWISVSSNTTPAEQYTRATVNGNMNDVRVHYYVDNVCAWQNLPLNLSGWHAADGGGNGNRRTIAIECIMSGAYNEVDKKSEDNCAKLAAGLLKKYGLGIESLYTHTHWLNVRDGRKGSVDELNVMRHSYKMCPAYILPHWNNFKAKVASYLYANPTETKTESKTETKTMYRIRKSWNDTASQIGAFTSLENAKSACKAGYTVFDDKGNKVYENKPKTKNNVIYRTFTNRWLSEIKNYDTTSEMGYSGIENTAITGFTGKADIGTLKYRVHLLGGGWLGWCCGYSTSDWNNCIAGNKKSIDGIQIKLENASGYSVKYRVSTVGSTSYSAWLDNNSTINYGKAIDKIQVEIV